MPNLPFTICTEDYAKDGTVTEVAGYDCESDYPITNINNKNRLSYCKFQAGKTPAFEIDLGATKSIDLILIELSRPFEVKGSPVYVKYWNGVVWVPPGLWATYTQSGSSLPGQVKQYAVIKFSSTFSLGQKFQVYFTDQNAAAQVEIRRVIFCGIIDEFDGGSDFYGPEEQSHSNVGKIQTALIHGNAFRAQSFGALKQSKQMRFSEVNPDQFKLLEDLESDYQTFGIMDWTGRYIECVIIQGGLQVQDSGIDSA